MNTKRLSLLILLRALALLWFLPICGRDAVVSQELEYVSWCLYGTPVPMDVQGDYLYVWPDAFGIFDISDSQNPVEVGRLLPHEQNGAACFVVHNNAIVYGIDGAGMLTVIDVSEKSAPAVVNSQYLGMVSGAYQGALLDYPWLFVTVENRVESQYYLYVIDITNPLGYVVVDASDLESELGFGLEQGIKDFVLDGNYLYITSAPGGTGAQGKAKFHVIDRTSPSDLIPVCSIELDTVVNGLDKWSGSHLALAKRSHYAYITGHFRDQNQQRYDLSIVDVSDPADPFVAATWNGDIHSVDIDISGDLAYITDYRTNGLFIVDIADSLDPVIRSSVTMPKPSYDVKDNLVKVVGSHAYMYMWDFYAIFDVDITDPDSPCLNNTIEFSHYLSDVSASGSYVYASIWDWLQFYSIDMTQPQTPIVASRTEVKGWGWGIDVKGYFAYLAMGASTFDPDSSGGLFVFDISDPAAPVPRGHCPTVKPVSLNHVVQVWVDTLQMLAYAAVGEPSPNIVGEPKTSATPGLCVINVFNPDYPQLFGFCPIPAQCRGVHALGDYAYVAAADSVEGSLNGGVYVVAVADPEHPHIVGHWLPSHTRSTRAVFVKGNHAYVAHHDSLVVLDVSDPELPSQTIAVPVETGCMDIVVDGTYAFVLTGSALRIFDVSNPSSPVEVASSRNIFNGSAHLDVEGEYIYVNASGLYTFRFSEWAERGDVNGDGEIDILDVIRAVNIILQIGLPPSEYEIWAADCNGDKSINVLDLIGIINVIMGIGSCEGNLLKIGDDGL